MAAEVALFGCLLTVTSSSRVSDGKNAFVYVHVLY